MVVIVIFNFAQQHLGGHPTNIKTGSNYAGEAWDHLPANLQPMKTRNGNLFWHGEVSLAAQQKRTHRNIVIGAKYTV